MTENTAVKTNKNTASICRLRKENHRQDLVPKKVYRTCQDPEMLPSPPTSLPCRGNGYNPGSHLIMEIDDTPVNDTFIFEPSSMTKILTEKIVKLYCEMLDHKVSVSPSWRRLSYLRTKLPEDVARAGQYKDVLKDFVTTKHQVRTNFLTAERMLPSTITVKPLKCKME
ncbi:uncharacterized protein LOC122948310 [Acropora millepora]|uniref:uncharacterized protein LOC122948310 n=1 Tax=Acropora millepora TaxID=45264 RepID=UPI001CF4AFBC|nr:uncharacterized protein LOC122948310 [Acropora millepora]